MLLMTLGFFRLQCREVFEVDDIRQIETAVDPSRSSCDRAGFGEETGKLPATRDKRHGVRPQDLVLSRYKHTARVDKTNDILPDINVLYSSRAVTYSSEIGVAKGGSLSDRH
jgi:hypothetical protein